MKPLSEQLEALSQRAKHVEDAVTAAQQKNRTALESQRTELDNAIDAGKAGVNTAASAAQSRWTEARRSVEQHFSELRADAQARRAERDVNKAERRADDAEEEAVDLIDYALDVLDQTEYALIEAAVARADADDLSLANDPSHTN